ncbi:GIY-YIG nuclease family protein [Flaviaesturariibacter terrae]
MRTYGGVVYILTNLRKTVLYIGVTSDLRKRLRQHIRHLYPTSFTARYKCTNLVYFERHPTIVDAIRREKLLKDWSRAQKLTLIVSVNPHMHFYDPDTLLPARGTP